MASTVDSKPCEQGTCLPPVTYQVFGARTVGDYFAWWARECQFENNKFKFVPIIVNGKHQTSTIVGYLAKRSFSDQFFTESLTWMAGWQLIFPHSNNKVTSSMKAMLPGCCSLAICLVKENNIRNKGIWTGKTSGFRERLNWVISRGNVSLHACLKLFTVGKRFSVVFWFISCLNLTWNQATLEIKSQDNECRLFWCAGTFVSNLNCYTKNTTTVFFSIIWPLYLAN